MIQPMLIFLKATQLMVTSFQLMTLRSCLTYHALPYFITVAWLKIRNTYII